MGLLRVEGREAREEVRRAGAERPLSTGAAADPPAPPAVPPTGTTVVVLALELRPVGSVVVSWVTYEPGAPKTCAAFTDDALAPSPKAQLKVSGSPSGSLLWPASNVEAAVDMTAVGARRWYS